MRAYPGPYGRPLTINVFRAVCDFSEKHILSADYATNAYSDSNQWVQGKKAVLSVAVETALL